MNWILDLRFAWRMIRKNPWFSAAIVATLALGMGVNTTVFSLVYGVLYKPLPFPGGERLVMAGATNAQHGQGLAWMSYADFRDFQREASSFERLEAMWTLPLDLTERGNPPDRIRAGRVSAGMFDMLRMKPILGRGLEPNDEKPGAARVLLLGYAVWRDRYGKDPAVIGRAVEINGKPASIVGVMPEGFRFPQREDAWMAVIPDADLEKRDNRLFALVGMLKDGTTLSEAKADLSLIARRLEREYPATHKDHGADVRTFHQAMNGGTIRTVFLLLLGAVGFVLLIACANVANMLFGRAVERNREMSIRAALGGSRWRLVRQFLIECLLLSAAGGVLGLGLAHFGTDAFSRAVENVGKPYWIDFSLDYFVFGYFAAITVVAALAFGLAPALSASRINLNETLKDGSRGSEGVRAGYVSGALVVLQFTLAVVLLSGAGLMIRSFLAAQDEYSGISGERVLSARVNLPSAKYPTAESRQQFYEKLIPKLEAMPGLAGASLVSNPPSEGASGWRFEIEGKLIAEARSRPAAAGIVAGPGYFRVLGLSLLRGRDFNDTDGLPGKEAVIVSRKFASRFFEGQEPVGKQIRVYSADKPRPWMTVIGVAPDLPHTNRGDRVDQPLIFVPYRFDSWSTMALAIRSRGTADSAIAPLRRQLQEVDKDLPVFEVMSFAEIFARSSWHLRVFGSLFLIFAVIAMGMAAVGIYAVMANATTRRTREIGVRMALGAGAGSILRMVLGRGARQVVIGLSLGLAAGFGVCRLMSAMLFRVSPADPVTFGVVAITLATAGLLATWLPARRAARLDPVKALRWD